MPNHELIWPCGIARAANICGRRRQRRAIGPMLQRLEAALAALQPVAVAA
jgi:hypothetical protein